MKKTLISFGLIIVVSINANAQYIFDWMNPSGVYNKTAVMSTVDNSDNLIVTGYLQSENIYTRKYDISGNFLWEAIDVSGIQSKYEKPIWLSCDAENNIFVVGKRYSISGPWEYPDAIVAIKYSPEGVSLWKQEIPVTVLIGSPHPAFNLRSETDQNGNLYIGTVTATPQGFVLIKINPSGTIQFIQNSTAGSPIGFWSMRLKGDKIIMAAGGSLTAPVMMWDTAGTILWSVSASGRGAKDVEIDAEGNVFIISNFSNQVSVNSGEDMVIYKYNTMGIQVWKKDFDFGGFEFSSKCVLRSGRLSITGYAISPGSGYFDWQTFQTDINGELLWLSTYNESMYNDEQPYFITADQNGEVIVTGKGGPSPDPNNPSYLQMVIVQYDNLGAQVWSDTPNIYGGWGLACGLASDQSLYAVSSANMTVYHYNPSQLTTINERGSNMEIMAWPNPFEDKIAVSLHDRDFKTSAFVHDSDGRLLLEFDLTGSENEMDLTELNIGFYFLRIESPNSSQIIKILKKK